VEVHCSVAETGFSNILHIFMVSAAQDHPQQWPKICLIPKNRIEKRETMHFSHSIYVVSELKKTKFWTFPSNRNSNKEKAESRWR